MIRAASGSSGKILLVILGCAALLLTLLVLAGVNAADVFKSFVEGSFKGWGPLTAAQVHLSVAGLALAINAGVNFAEYVALSRNGRLVNEVLQEVRRIRKERGLEVENGVINEERRMQSEE